MDLSASVRVFFSGKVLNMEIPVGGNGVYIVFVEVKFRQKYR
jgi:hypothetical protein